MARGVVVAMTSAAEERLGIPEGPCASVSPLQRRAEQIAALEVPKYSKANERRVPKLHIAELHGLEPLSQSFDGSNQIRHRLVPWR
jgi:hypothetical protein